MEGNKAVLDVIDKAVSYAANNSLEYVTPEVVLLALCDDKDFVEVLIKCGADPARLKGMLSEYVNNYIDKVKDEVPVQYKESADVKNSLIANGCEIRGEVENSILFRGVKIAKGVKVKNSIIMQRCEIQEGALIENVICDKNVVITKDKWLKGAPTYPLIVTKNVVI